METPDYIFLTKKSKWFSCYCWYLIITNNDNRSNNLWHKKVQYGFPNQLHLCLLTLMKLWQGGWKVIPNDIFIIVWSIHIYFLYKHCQVTSVLSIFFYIWKRKWFIIIYNSHLGWERQSYAKSCIWQYICGFRVSVKQDYLGIFSLKGGGVPYSQMYMSEYWKSERIVKPENAP